MAPLNQPLIDFTLTCDRPCMTERGLMIHPGTEVRWVEAVYARRVRVLMVDGAIEEVDPTCFRQSRELAEWKARVRRGLPREGGDDGGIRDAVEALPDTTKLRRLSGDARMYFETQFALIKGG